METEIVHTTGSRYKGPLTNQKRMNGFGVFHFTTGTKFVGNFKDGMFHGKGMLFFPNGGGKFESTWENGQCLGPGGKTADCDETSGEYTFADGLQYRHLDWDYCSLEDRRFHSERCNEILPAGRMQLTDNSSTVAIPLGWYDCCDGLYNPNKRVVYTYDGITFLRNADTEEHDWIVNNCRKGVTEAEQLDSVTRLYKINS